MIQIDDRTFDKKVLEAPEPVLVDFSASWCVPCQRQTPILAKLAALRPDVTVVTVDIDACPLLSERFNITSIPTLLLFHKGKMIKSTVGLHSLSELEEMLK